MRYAVHSRRRWGSPASLCVDGELKLFPGAAAGRALPEPSELCYALSPLPPPPGFASRSGLSPADRFLAMQLLLSLQSGSVCHSHSGQDLKHLLQKNATKILIFTLAK